MNKKIIVLKDSDEDVVDFIFSTKTTTPQELSDLIAKTKEKMESNWTIDDLFNNLPKDIEVIYDQWTDKDRIIYY